MRGKKKSSYTLSVYISLRRVWLLLYMARWTLHSSRKILCTLMYGIIKVLFAFDLEDLSCTLHPCQYNKAVKQMYLLVLYSTLCKKPHIHRVTYRRQHKCSTSLQMRVYSKSLEGVRRGQQASIISAYYRRMSDARVSSCVKCYGDTCCVFRVSDNGFKP
jgi:hypothetical protein